MSFDEEMAESTRMVTACVVSGWHEWARQSPEVREKHRVGVRDDLEYWDCPFCPSTHTRDLRPSTRVGRGRAVRADVSKQEPEPPLTPLVPEAWSACEECRAPCPGDFCSAECRVEWTARWAASGRGELAVAS